MAQVSVRLDDDLLEEIEDYADDEPRSEAIRELLRRGLEYDELATENERLQRRVEALIDNRDEHTELVNYVEDERRYRREREQAGIITRAKWLLVGRDVEDGAEA